MENFYFNDTFYFDIGHLLEDLDLTEDEEIKRLPDDYEIEIELTTKEKIFVLKPDFIVDTIIENTDKFADRFPDEDDDDIFSQIKSAIKSGIDIDKINNALPSLYYPNGRKGVLTKQDLLEYIE